MLNPRWLLASALFGVLLQGLPMQGLSANAFAQRPEKLQAEDHTVTTLDGVAIKLTYYPSSAGKDAVPVVMLHDLKGSRQVFKSLAQRMQRPSDKSGNQSFAVVTVDLRGHGDSMTQTMRNGSVREIDNARLNKKDMAAMVLGDLEAVRKFLVTENDKKRLNLNRLSVVGIGVGAIVGTNWAARDWSMEKLPRIKQGQDVKSMVLISPEWQTKGLSVIKALRQPGVQSQVATLLLYGSGDRKMTATAERYYDQLADARPEVEGVDSNDLPSVLKLGTDTPLQGAAWLKQTGRAGEDGIIRFLNKHSAEPDFPWSIRRPQY